MQQRGRYSFAREEAIARSGLTVQAAAKALQHSVKRGHLLKPRDSFYVIVPVEYRLAGGPPVSWYIDELMTAMKLRYYVGLLSAAAQHGASHHQPQEFQVVAEKWMRPMVVGRLKIHFLGSKYVAGAAVVRVKTPTGLMSVATPETTAVDLVRFSKAAGYLNHMATTLGELADLMHPRKLVGALDVAKDVPNAQRLGYLLEVLGRDRLAAAVHRWVGGKIERVQRLRSDLPAEGATVDERWQLLINMPVEVEG